MRILHIGCLGIALLCSSIFPAAYAQDKEFQKVLAEVVAEDLRPDAAKRVLVSMKSEHDGLKKVVGRLMDYQFKQLSNLEANSKRLFEKASGDDLETTQVLLRNSRMELQKLSWDEAAESTMLQEMEKDQKKSGLTRQTMMEADLRGRLEIAKREIAAQQRKLTEMNKENHSRSVITEQLTKVDRAQVEMDVLAKQLDKFAEINKAESETPVTESKRRLAQIRMRRHLLEDEIEELTKKLPELREVAAEQRQLDRERKVLDALEARITPLQLRQVELEALISVLEEKFKAEQVEETK